MSQISDDVKQAVVSLLDILVCDVIERNADRLLLARNGGPALLKRRDAAEYLAVSPSTLDQLRKDGEVVTIMVGGQPKYPRSELDKYIRRLLRGKAK